MKLLRYLALFLILGTGGTEPEPAAVPARESNKSGGQQAKAAARPAAGPASAAGKAEPDKGPEYKKAGKEGVKPPKPPKPK